MRSALAQTKTKTQYGQKLFGTNSGVADSTSGDQDPEDVEAAIEKELAAMKPSNKPKDAAFDLLKMNVDCVLFMRTRAPVDPLALVREICKDAAAAKDRSLWRSRFVNKLTPITNTAKATEKGLEDVAKSVLAPHFRLAGDETEETAETVSGENNACSVSTYLREKDGSIATSSGHISHVTTLHLENVMKPRVRQLTPTLQQYAIRPTIRAHTTLKRSEVIEKVANMISKQHKVDLENPDKVIIIEIFQVRVRLSLPPTLYI